MRTRLFIAFAIIALGLQLQGQNSIKDAISTVEYRNLGPYKVGSWITSIAVPSKKDQKNKHTFYIGARNGGVWKTINNGTTFFPIFDSTGVSSIGAIAIDPLNPEILWVGTGEAYNARSSHPGKGIYKSYNGGKTWQFMGLENTQHIPKVIINDRDTQIVYVASMGSLFTPNSDRGVYKTIDGGKTWKKVLFINENTGVIDLVMNPNNPNELFAAAYEKYRYPWSVEAGGLNSGIYKSNDGGETWTKLKNGLPEGKLGRIGLCIYPENPSILYTVIENLNPKYAGQKIKNVKADHQRDPYYDQLLGGQVYKSEDNGNSWRLCNDTTYNVSGKAAYSFNQIFVSSKDPNRLFIISDGMLNSEDGGKTWPDIEYKNRKYFSNIFGDFRTMWIDPEDPQHLMTGSDGGLYTSWDGGVNMEFSYQIPLGEMYNIEYDDAFPYNIYVGMQDHDGWKGPVNGWAGVVGQDDWHLTGMWDGMYTCVDHKDNRWAYITTQFGGHRRIDQVLGTRTDIEPKAAVNSPDYRFCWTPPLHLSPHNQQIIYTGGQYLLRSYDQGNHWEPMSPDLTDNDSTKTTGRGHTMYCTITTISESPVKQGVIWIGTDDGHVWVTLDNGKNWKECTGLITQVGGHKSWYVERVFASPHDAGTVYVCKSGYRDDSLIPEVFASSDYGVTWKKITNGLPQSAVNVIIEDPKKKDLLYLGNNEGVFVSFNAGKEWLSLKNNMPPVPVKDIKIHPESNDLLVATYGRGAYVSDAWLLQNISDSLLGLPSYLFPVESKPQTNYSERATWGNILWLGDNFLYTPNEPNGLSIFINLKSSLKVAPELTITSSNNFNSGPLKIKNVAGLQKIIWDTKDAKPGVYTVTLKAGGKTFNQETLVTQSPIWPVGKGTWDKF